MLKHTRTVIASLLLVVLAACATNNNSSIYYDYHVVLVGDTLYSIAWQHGVDYKELAAWNNIRTPYTIYPGQRLRLTSPAGTDAIPLIVIFCLLVGFIFWLILKAVMGIRISVKDEEEGTKSDRKIGADLQYDLKISLEKTISGFEIKKVYRVIDGDSIIVGDTRSNFEVRLYAIDCPEYNQPWGDKAKYGLIRLIGGRNIRIEVHKPRYDKFKRVLATVYVKSDPGNEWVNVNAKMVVLGHAWVIRPRKFYEDLSKERQNDLHSKERWAKSKKIGLWGTENPTPPWDWRNLITYAQKIKNDTKG